MVIDYIDIESVATGKIQKYVTMTFASAPSRARRVVVHNDILLSTVRPYLRAIALVQNSTPNKTVCSTGFATIRPFAIFPGYAYQFILSDTFINQLVEKMVGSNYPAVNSSDVKNAILPIPPLLEQRKIAEILSTVDKHINEIESLIEKTKTFKQGMMQRLLTKGIGHTEFKNTEIGRIPVEWEVVPFSKYVYFQEGPGLRNWQYSETGMPFLNIRCLQNGSIDHSKIQYISIDEFNSKYQHFGLDAGDIVVSSSGTLGKKAIVQRSDLPIMLNTSIIRMRSIDNNKLSRAFLNYFIESDYYQKAVAFESTGSAQVNYGPYHLGRLKMYIPSNQEQQQITSVLTTIDDQINLYQTKLNALSRLKSGLMQQLLTGKIRVKV